MNNVATTLRAARKAKGMTQQALGDACGYKPSAARMIVSKWEAGAQPIPVAKIKKIAALLDISPAELLPDG